MVAGMRSSLLAGGTDVTEAIVNGSLTLSSNTDHLLDRRFDTDRMIDMLEQALYQALHDGYDGLWAKTFHYYQFRRDDFLAHSALTSNEYLGV